MTERKGKSLGVWPWLVCLLLASLLALPFYLLARPQLLLAGIDWAMAEFSDVRLAWVEPEIDIYGGHVSAREFHLVTSDGIALVSLFQLAVTTEVSDVLTMDFEHSTLRADEAVVYLPLTGEEGGDEDGAETASLLSYLAYLPQTLQLGRGHLLLQDDTLRVIGLDGLLGRRVDDDSYLMQTTPVYLGDSLDLVVELQAVTAEGQVTELLFEATVTDVESASELGLAGTLRAMANNIQYDLHLQSHYPDISLFLRGLEVPEQLQGQLVLNGRLSGDQAGFLLTDVSAQLDNLPSYAFDAKGELEYSLTGDSRLAVQAHGELQSVESLLSWVDTGAGEFGRAEAQIALSGSLQSPVIDVFELSTRNRQGLELSLSGHMAQLQAATSTGANQLHITAAAPNLAALEPWLGEVPWELGAWQAEFDLKEVGEQVRLDNIQIAAGFEETLAISARGSIANVARVLEEEIAGLENVDLAFTVTSADASSLARWFDYQPLAGHSLAAKLRLRGDGADFAAEGGTIRLEGEDLSVVSEAVALRLDLLSQEPLSELRAPLTVALTDTSALTHYVGAEVPALGKVAADLELLFADGRLSAQVVNADIRGKQLQLSAQGEVADVLAAEGIAMHATLAVTDPALMEELTGLRMAPGKGSMNLTASSRAAELHADLRLGDSPLDLRAGVRFAGGDLAGLDLKLHSQRLLLDDLGLQSSATENNQYSPAERIGEQSEELSLSSILEVLPSYPLNLELRVGRVLGDNTDLTGLQLDAEGRAGRYTLRRLAADAGEASIEFMGVIDSNFKAPALSLAGQALGVPTGMIASDLGVDADFEGTVILSGGLTAYGDTGELLLDHLDGQFALAVKNAVIEGAAYDVLATDLLGWIYKGAAMESTTRIDCSMADFTVRRGVATSDRLYIETDRMIASGTVEVDLAQEHLDLTLTPHSKSRAFQVESAVRLKGPFSDLQPEISPISAAADAYMAWFTLVPQITLEMFGYEGEGGEQQPCRIWGKE